MQWSDSQGSNLLGAIHDAFVIWGGNGMQFLIDSSPPPTHTHRPQKQTKELTGIGSCSLKTKAMISVHT